MRDIIVFSKTQIIKDECIEKLKKDISCIKENGNDLMIDSTNRLYINFSSQRINEPKDETSEELQKSIPIDNAFLTFIETYRSIDAKRVLTSLMEIYKELFVYVDDTDWYGTATEFINATFDF